MSTKDEYSEMLEHRLTYTARWVISSQRINEHIRKIMDLLKQYENLPPEFTYQLCDGLLKLFELYNDEYEIANLMKRTAEQEIELINHFHFED